MSFWLQFEQAACYPDKCMCEAIRDALIRQPVAFWSSFAYVICGIAIYRYVSVKSPQLKLWAGVCIVMGLTSLLGHMSFTRFALALDFAAIIMVLSFFALSNLFIVLQQSTRRIVMYLSLYFTTLFFVMYYMPKWPKIFFCVLIALFAIGDVAREMGREFLKAKKLQIAIALLAGSFVFFLFDEFHFMCRPYSSFQFHGLWHMGTAMSMFLYGQWRFSAAANR